MLKRAEVLLLVCKKIEEIFLSFFLYVHNFKLLDYKVLVSILLHSRCVEISKGMLPIRVYVL
jgi:hypothetical protein